MLNCGRWNILEDYMKDKDVSFSMKKGDISCTIFQVEAEVEVE